MAGKVVGASLNPIMSRLSAAPEYHPLEADTFADWSVEAGDMVTMSRDGTSYKSPVHQASMNWRRGQQVSLSSTGKKQRDSVSRLTQRKYRTGGSGLRNDNYIHMYVTDQYNQLQSGLELTASSAYLYSKDFYNQMESGLRLTASSATLYVDSKYNQMSSGLRLTASSAALYVDSKYNQMSSGLVLSTSSAVLYAQSRTSRAYIMARINANGEGEALIEADKVKITGTTTLNNVMTIISNAVGFKAPVICSDNLNINSRGTLNLYNATFQGTNPVSLNALTLASMIKSASVNNNTLTLTPFIGEPITFSKATSISQSWNSGNSSVKATASGASDKYYNVDYRFNANSGQYYMEMIHTSDGGSTTALSGTSRRIKLGKSGNTIRIENENGTKYSNTPTYTMVLQSKSVSSNGTVTPDAGYDGLSSVDVNVSSASYQDRTLRCTAIEQTYPGSSTYFYTFRLEGNYSMFAVGNNTTMYKPSWY